MIEIRTREDLREVLKSKENRMAVRAIEIIRNQGPIEELQKLIDSGCPGMACERIPRKQRYRVTSVLSACYESWFGVIRERPTGGGAVSMELGIVHESAGREKYFELLLDHPQFTADNNEWRGDLFRHIYNCCFYQGRDDKEQRRQGLIFARILARKRPETLQHYVVNHYGWNGHPDNLKTVLDLGADPTGPGMIDCALNYLSCDPQPYTTEDRIAVVLQLLELGARPERKRFRKHVMTLVERKIQDSGIYDALEKFGVLKDS